MDLDEAHAVATRLEQAILQSNNLLRRVTTHLEAPTNGVVHRQDVTLHYPEMTEHICYIANTIAGSNSAHEIHLYCSKSITANLKGYRSGSTRIAHELDLVLHTTFAAHAPLSQVHAQAEEIKRALRQSYPDLGSVIIHTEPPEVS
jgi:divalent metal cation (Fe/Co/Zn/Cd) transporter